MAMAPDRILGKHPRFASYLILGCALVIFGLSIWVYLLSGRVSDGEALRRSEAKAAQARAASECRSRIAGTKITNDLLEAIRDLARIPQTNLKTYLAGPLAPMERSNYEDALARYRKAESKFAPFPIPTCVRSDP